MIMEKLSLPLNRDQVKLTMAPMWLKIGPCLVECDKKDLMHVVGSTLGVIMFGSCGFLLFGSCGFLLSH